MMHPTFLRVGLVGLMMLAGASARTQELQLDIGGILDAAQEWAKANLDEETLRALSEVNREQVETFLRQFQAELQGKYVLDLAALKQAANTVLPLLDAQEETKPYAAWLRSRLDYFDVAEGLHKSLPPPQSIPVEPAKPPPNPSSAAGRQAWQAELKERDLPRGAAELVPRLKPIFAAEQVPVQLVWLAEVESGFNPGARSPAGAAGLFQLMPETAQSLGLRRWPLDQRHQPEPSARAAARYLKHLRNRFGDWRLALAAYNAGEGRVQQLLEGRPNRSFDVIAPHLPAETQMFVPKVEATILRREGVTLESLGPPRR